VVMSDSTLVISNRTAIGIFSGMNREGLSVRAGAKIFCEGEPNHLNYIVNYNTVQEQSKTNWINPHPISLLVPQVSSSNASEMSFRFTEWCLIGSGGFHIYGLSNGAL